MKVGNVGWNENESMELAIRRGNVKGSEIGIATLNEIATIKWEYIWT